MTKLLILATKVAAGAVVVKLATHMLDAYEAKKHRDYEADNRSTWDPSPECSTPTDEKWRLAC